jgi:6-pyruvoyltetrahydropterin/6-carboxytetrahydropterin synthase
VYEVSCETTFNATHRLTQDGRPLEPLHGHDWRVEAFAVGEHLDSAGLLIDFVTLKRALDDTAAVLHHTDLNARTEFAGTSPSAEVVARHFFNEIVRRLGEGGQALVRVRVREAPGCSATYAKS